MSMTRPIGGRRERGISLLVALILLLVMTLLGLAVLRSTVLEERMSANMLDRTYQFQAAESALRQGEKVLANGAFSVPDSGCSAGVCATPTAGATDRWMDSSFSGWASSDGTGDFDDTITTQYFAEYMGDGAYGPDCNVSKSTSSQTDPTCSMLRYRVTSRSQGADGDGRATVILQSNYLTAQ
jgi:type IV pilus assembly protein PilX